MRRILLKVVSMKDVIKWKGEEIFGKIHPSHIM